MSSKGKGKLPASHEASVGETAPLLGESAGNAARIPSLSHGRGPLVEEEDSDDDEHHNEDHPHQRRARRRTFRQLLCFGFLTLLFTLVLAGIAALVWIGHALSEERQKELNIEEGVKWSGPTAVRILPLAGDQGKDGVLLEVEGRVGVDVRKVLAWEGDSRERSWTKQAEAKLVRWTTKQIKVVQVQVGEINIVSSTGEEILTILDSNPVLVHLNYPSSSSEHIEMVDNTLRLPIAVPSVEALSKFLQRAWDSKAYQFDVQLRKVVVVPGKTSGVLKQLLRWMGPVNVDSVAKSLSGKGQ